MQATFTEALTQNSQSVSSSIQNLSVETEELNPDISPVFKEQKEKLTEEIIAY